MNSAHSPVDLITGMWHLAPVSLACLALAVALAFFTSGPGAIAAPEGPPTPGKGALAAPDPALGSAATAAKQALRAKHGDGEWARIDRGVDQVLRYWRKEDGDAAAFSNFVQSEFLPSGPALDGTFARLEFVMERIGGYMVSLSRDLRQGLDVEIGPVLPLDDILGGYDPSAHLSDDLFMNKTAFVALLNFPLTTLELRLAEGANWSRRQWAEARLAQAFSTRVPAEINQRLSEAASAADTYVSNYNIYMHHLLTADGKRLFPEGLRLISHWNLRDELKARYSNPDGLPRQRMIQQVMEKIVRQEIPAAVVNNPLLDWTPDTDAVAVSKVKDAEAPEGAEAVARSDREPDERYRVWLGIFKANRLADPYHPDNPTLMDRRFNVDREIPEAQVKSLFESVLTSPLGERVGRLIEKRLGRPLEPFDIWYAGFKPRSKYQEPELDAATKRKYPTAEAYAADMPRMFRDLGFSDEKARFLADHIVVDPSRGVGHASGAERRDDKAHLRTRVGPGGMDYKGYNIAIHEMGHNVEQVFTVTSIDHTLLQGVPNTGFTEAMAMLFQSRDMKLLGLAGPDPAAENLRALEEFWATREIASVSLVDMASWRWLYEHPEATPEQFREAVVNIAREIWNRYYAPIFKTKDTPLLAIYSHMVDSSLYLPDYTLGHLIAFQVEEHFKKNAGSLGAEFERVCLQGSITPDAWMKGAVGGPLSADPMLKAAEVALKALGN